MAHLGRLDTEHLIVCGDFNCILDSNLDLVSGAPHPKRKIELFQEAVAEVDLIDVWRMFNPEEKTFTWSINRPLVARRLDYAFSTEPVFDRITHSAIQSVPFSPHRSVELYYKISHIDRGPNYWKCNDSLLRDQGFVEKMNEMILSYSNQTDGKDAQLTWDLFKILVR